MRPPPLFKQLLIPPATIGLAEILFPLYPILPYPLLAAGIAALLSVFARNRAYWHGLHASVFVLAWFASSWEIAASWYLFAATLLALIYSGLMFSNVPLYFTGQEQINAVATLATDGDKRIADIGAGIGSAVIPIALAHPNIHIDAFEIAPLPYLLGKWRSRRFRNLHWHFQPYESTDFSNYDIVFCYLSPEPMSFVWQKALAEMRPNSLLISNSFAIQGAEPSQILLADSRHPLFVYKL